MSGIRRNAGPAGRGPARDVTGPDGWVKVSRNVWIKKGFTKYDITPYIIIKIGDKEIHIYASDPDYHGDLSYDVYEGNKRVAWG